MLMGQACFREHLKSFLTLFDRLEINISEADATFHSRVGLFKFYKKNVYILLTVSFRASKEEMRKEDRG